MTDFISLAQAFAQWQELAADIDENDGPALAESWNNYTDSLCDGGELSPLQYHYTPAYDDAMPGTGSRYDALSDDRDFILERMGVTMAATFVPFSQSRNKAEKQPSLNWRCTIRYGTTVIAEDVDYMQGCAHAPAYNTPQTFENRKRDQWRTDRAIAFECENGRRCKGVAPSGHVVGGKKALDAPDMSDVIHSLLMDASAIDARDFADWASDYGFDTDSIKARQTYEECVAIGLRLRAAFGGQRFEELRELFADM